MGSPTEIPSGAQGIPVREQQLKDPLTVPLSPDDMWRQAVQDQRGFNSSPSGPTDAMRKKAATVPVGKHGVGDPKLVGPPVGKGYETFASIQILGKDGQRVAIGADYFDGGGSDDHAEAKVIRALEKNAPSRVPEGKMILVVEKEPCPECAKKLRSYARKRGLLEIEVHVPERESLTRKGTMVTPKTAARTSFQGGKRGPTGLRRLETITIPYDSPPSVQRNPAINARTAIVGTIGNLGAGIALGILNSKFKESMQESLAKLPKPKIDKRSANDFFSDPSTGRAIRLIDVMQKNLGRFANELAKAHAGLIGTANIEVALLAVSSMPVFERLEFLNQIEEQLQKRRRELSVVNDNLTAAIELEEKSLVAAKAAEELANLIDRALIADYLLKLGFSIEEIVDIYTKLTFYASLVRNVFKELKQIRGEVQRMIDEMHELSAVIEKLFWHIARSETK